MKKRNLKAAAILLFAVMLLGMLPVAGVHAAGSTVAVIACIIGIFCRGTN